MTLDIARNVYNGRIKEIELGTGDKKVTVGGETCFSFHLFEGKMAHLPRIAMEVWDYEPKDWPRAALEPFAGVTHDPVLWAKKCVSDYHAEMIALELVSTDPNGLNRGADEAVEVVKRVADNINVPLIVWGSGNHEKDAEVLPMVAQACSGMNIAIGPVSEENHKKISPAAIANRQTIISSSPIDINLAKQLNILLGNAGVSESRIIMDPTVSSIGYGIEYCYSVMERTRMAALTQGDDKLQFPMIVNIGKEVWKTKEAGMPEAEDPKLGDATKRGILLEAMSATMLALAGADVLVMRHPEAIRLVREVIKELGTE
jgi:acetyl-CoA decarbonylase/synthase complex subunit delta